MTTPSPREAAFEALFNLLSPLQAAGTVQTLDRRTRLIENVDGADFPAIFVSATHQKVQQQGDGNPGIRTLGAYLYVYARNTDDSVAASTILNTLIDAIEVALAPDWTGVQTLEGLVQHAWIEGTIEVFDGKLSELAAAIIPVQIRMP